MRKYVVSDRVRNSSTSLLSVVTVRLITLSIMSQIDKIESGDLRKNAVSCSVINGQL